MKFSEIGSAMVLDTKNGEETLTLRDTDFVCWMRKRLSLDWRLCRWGMSCKSVITRCHVRWLALHAFVRVLGKKQSSYTLLVAALQGEMREKQYSMLRAQLSAVVDPKRSAAFDSIIY